MPYDFDKTRILHLAGIDESEEPDDGEIMPSNTLVESVRPNEADEERKVYESIRDVIREELKDIIASSGGRWVYNGKNPKNSRKGAVTVGFAGIGFKKE